LKENNLKFIRAAGFLLNFISWMSLFHFALKVWDGTPGYKPAQFSFQGLATELVQHIVVDITGTT
jgi:hypothetical protein